MSEGLRGARLRYDRVEDRLALRFETGGRGHCFWVTRRHCAGLIASLSPAALKAAAAMTMPRGRQADGAASAGEGDGLPVLAVISLRRTAKSVRLGFKSNGDAVTLDCTTADFVKLQCLFYRLAKVAGWALEPVDAARGLEGTDTAAARRLH